MAKDPTANYKALVQKLRKQLQTEKVSDRRKFGRYPAQVDVQVKRSAGRDKPTSIKVKAADIASHGVGIVDFPTRLRKGEKVEVVLAKGDGSLKMTSSARVVRCEKTAAGYSVGLVFLKDFDS